MQNFWRHGGRRLVLFYMEEDYDKLVAKVSPQRSGTARPANVPFSSLKTPSPNWTMTIYIESHQSTQFYRDNKNGN